MKKQRYRGQKHDIFVRKADLLSAGLEDVLKVSRLATGIGIAQGLNDGTIGVQDLALELIGLPPELASDKFKEEDIDQLVEPIEQFITAANDGCSQNSNPCFNLNVVKMGSDGLKKAGALPSVDYQRVFQDGSPIQTLEKVQQVLVEITGKLKASEDFHKHLNTILDDTSDPKEVTTAVRNLINSPEALLKKFEIQFIYSEVQSLVKEKLDADVKEILKIETISSALNAQGTNVALQKKTLVAMREKVTKMKEIMSKEKFQEWATKFNLLTGIGNSAALSIQQKRFTHGFFEGAEDFSRMFADFNSDFVKNKLIRGLNLKLLKKFFTPLEPLSKETVTVYKSFHNEPDVTLDARTFLDVIKVALDEIEDLDDIQEFSECLEKVSAFEGEFNIADWTGEKTRIGKLGNAAKDFAENFMKISVNLPELQSFAEKVQDENLSPAQLKNIIKQYPNIDKVKSELTNYKTSLTGLMTAEISSWLKSTKIGDIIQSTKTSFESSDINSALQCVKNDEMYKKVDRVVGKGSGFAGIQLLKNDNAHFANCRERLKRMKTNYSEFQKMVNKLKNTKFRFTEKQAILDKAMTVGRDLATSVSYFRKASKASLSKKEIELLVTLENSIDDSIKKMADPEVKVKMGKLWSGEARDRLKKLPALIDKMEESLKIQPKTVEAYVNMFKDAKFDGLGNSTVRDLIVELQLAKFAELSDEDAEKLKALDLDFTNAQSSMKAGADAFLLLIPFFTVLAKEAQQAEDSKTIGNSSEVDASTEAGHGSWIMIGLIVLGIFVLIGILVGVAVCWWCKYRNKDTEDNNTDEKGEKKVKKDKKKKTKRKSKDSANIENGVSTDTSGNASTTTNGSTASKTSTTSKASNASKTSTVSTATTASTVTTASSASSASTASTSATPEKPPPENTTTYPENMVISRSDGQHIITFDDSQNIPKGEDHKPKDSEEARKEKLKNLLKKRKADERMKRMKQIQEDDKICKQRFAKRYYNYEYYIHTDFTPDKLRKVKNDVYENIPLPDMGDKKPEYNVCKTEYKVGRKLDLFEIDDNNATKSEKSLKTQSTQEETPELEEKTKSEMKEFKDFSEGIMKRMEEHQNPSLNPVERFEAGLDEAWRFGKYCWRKMSKQEQQVKRHLSFLDNEPPRFYAGRDSRNDDLPIEFKHENKDQNRKFIIENVVANLLSKKFVTAKKTCLSKLLLGLRDCKKLMELAEDKFREEKALLKIDRHRTRVVGDIHGSYMDFVRQLGLALKDDSTVIFTGDFVDRGFRSIDVLILMCAMKILNPNKFIFIRGNHELKEVNGRYGFKEECIRVFGQTKGEKFYDFANEFFNSLPVCSILNKSFWVAHGGISKFMLNGPESFKMIKKVPETDDEKRFFFDILWGDPLDAYTSENKIMKGFMRSRRLPKKKDEQQEEEEDEDYPFTDFTYLGYKQVMDACGLKGIIRGHQIKNAGFEPFFGVGGFTVYGSINNNEEYNKAAQAVITSDLKVNFIRFSPRTHRRPRKKEETEPDTEAVVEEVYQQKIERRMKRKKQRKTI